MPLNELRYEWSYEDIIQACAVLDMNMAISLVSDFVAESENGGSYR